MNSPSPSKPKWTPGGAIRRTSTLLSISRSKTPSRSSSIHESDSSPSKGVAVKGVAAAPAAPAPKSVSPKSTLSTESPSQEPTITPSKSPLARMGTALRRPSSLIPRRRTTSTASSIRDGNSTPSKAASAIRSSTELAIKPNPTAEPATPQAPKSTVPESRSSVPESQHVLPPVIESTKAQFADKPEETLQKVVGRPAFSSSHEHAAFATEEARDEPLELSAAMVSDLAPILLLAEQISAEPEVVQPSLAPISTAVPVSEQPPAQLEDAKSSIAPISTLEPALGQNAEQEAKQAPLTPRFAPEPASEHVNPQSEAKMSSLAPLSTSEPALEHVGTQSEAEMTSPAPLSTSEPASEQIRLHSKVEEPSIVSHSTLEPVPASLATDAVTPSSEIEELSTVTIIAKEAVTTSPTPPTHSVAEIVEDALPSAGPATQDAIVEAPHVVASPLPVTEVGMAPSALKPEHVAEPLREVSSLNSSFEDLALSTEPAEDEVVVVQKDVIVDYPSVLQTPAGVVAPSPTETTEKVSTVVVPAAKESSSIINLKSSELIRGITKESGADAPVVPVPHIAQEPRRTPPLEIPTTSAESAAPSPAATHPLLPLEVQEFPPRQRNGSLGPVRDHHAKTPQEYKSMLRKLFDGLVGLIRHWRRCLW